MTKNATAAHTCAPGPKQSARDWIRIPPPKGQLSQNHVSQKDAKVWSVRRHMPPTQALPCGRSLQKTEHKRANFCNNTSP